MQVKTKNGECKITLDARERRAIDSAQLVAEDIESFAPEHIALEATKVLAAIQMLRKAIEPADTNGKAPSEDQ